MSEAIDEFGWSENVDPMIVSANDCFIATDVKLGGGNIFTDAQPDCECPGGIHKQSKQYKIFTMILIDPQGREQIVVVPHDSAFGQAIIDGDLYYYFKSLVEG